MEVALSVCTLKSTTPQVLDKLYVKKSLEILLPTLVVEAWVFCKILKSVFLESDK